FSLHQNLCTRPTQVRGWAAYLRHSRYYPLRGRIIIGACFRSQVSDPTAINPEVFSGVPSSTHVVTGLFQGLFPMLSLGRQLFSPFRRDLSQRLLALRMARKAGSMYRSE